MTAALPAEPLSWPDLARQVTALEEASDLHDLLARAARTAARQGADLLALAQVDDTGAAPRLILRTGVFPPAWRAAWVAQGPLGEGLARLAVEADGPFPLGSPMPLPFAEEDACGPQVRKGEVFPYRRPRGGEIDLVLVAGEALRDGPEAAAQHRLLADVFRAVASARLNRDRPRPRLTARQLACLRAAQHGRSSGEIGADLRLAPKTVDVYLAAAAERLGARNRTAAVSAALRLGLL